MSVEEKVILNVGLACLDMVMVCSSYPVEDSDTRCESNEWRRGGNASNMCTVLADFKIPTEYFGTLSSDCGGKFLKEDFDNCGIVTDNCVVYKDHACPTSIVLINSENGSRTIVHSNKNLPELTAEEFKRLDLKKYKWIHFEARPTIDEVIKMIEYIDDWNAKPQNKNHSVCVSIEIEKPIASYLQLLHYGDVVFISKDVAKFCNCDSPLFAVKSLSGKLKPGSLLICPWDKEGAFAKWNGKDKVYHAESCLPGILVDTLAAGDTFIAMTIASLSKRQTVKQSIKKGCLVAGAKCCINGLRGLSNAFPCLDFT